MNGTSYERMMQLKAFVQKVCSVFSMCMCSASWCCLIFFLFVVSQWSKGAKCLQSLHNINRLVSTEFFCFFCAISRHLVRLSVLSCWIVIIAWNHMKIYYFFLLALFNYHRYFNFFCRLFFFVSICQICMQLQKKKHYQCILKLNQFHALPLFYFHIHIECCA